MCGIAGIVETASAEPSISESILRKMSTVIHHRGPDDDGLWMSPNHRCGFVFRRLAIIDTSPAGHQPMSTSDGRFTIVFNGEIYNHAILRRDLEERGYQYNSKTDTETILYGYREYGQNFLSKMVGMWDLAIWDNDKQELFCSRDRIGIKPLYYSYQQGRFIFGSEIKSILEHPSISREMNIREMTNYLSFSMTSEHSTLFEGIHKLPAGHFLRLKADGTISTERYWSPLPPNTPYSTLSEKETIDEIMRLLRQAVKDRMMSDVPFGVFLSGGVDSSTNVALMAELMDRPIDTFSVGFKELEKYNEMEYARKVAGIFKTNHREVLIDHNDALPVMEELVWHEDEPNGDPVCIPLYFLSKLTQESGTTVIQVGEGSDEQFVGYPWMVRELKFHNSYWKNFRQLPKFIQRSIYSATKPIFQARGQYLALDYIRRAVEDNPLYWGGAVDITPSYLERLLTPQFREYSRSPVQMAKRLNNDALSRQSHEDFIQQMAFVELSHRLPELLLMRVDKMTMAHSLEARVPFLDHRLVEFSMTIPANIKLPIGATTKHLLKKGVEQILPKDIIYRKKQGFDAPIKEWLRNQWYDYTKSIIFNSHLVKSGMLDANFIQFMLDFHRAGRGKFARPIFAILNLCLWHKRFFENN
ncbi:MAG: asparagine synthase (glutamine-hydrolyzing) [Bacteroidetes bacterium]|nr:asparagine synthase (glutamine-hydrolyzing) [Bacteroidota bacterium]